MIAFDTNIYAYTLDSDAPFKREVSIKLLQSQAGLIDARPLLWQVACEFLSFLRRQQGKQRIDDAGVQFEMGNLLNNHRLILPCREIVSRSMDLTMRFSLSHWDSLLLAACIESGIDTVYSEDMSHGMTYDSVTVINPFKNP